MRPFLARVAVTVLLTGAGTLANADVIRWDLNNAVFDDGGSAAGFYTFDLAANTYEFWSITTTDGLQANGSGSLLSAFEYTNADSLLTNGSGGCTLSFVANSDPRSLCLNLQLLSDGSYLIDPNSYERDGSTLRFLISGTVVDLPVGGGDAVPEPSAIFLLAAAIGGLFGLRYYRTRRALPDSRNLP